MRFLAAGLVLIAVGIGLTEYSRRHPSDGKTTTPSGSNTPKAPVVPPTMTALVETTPLPAVTPQSLEGIAAELPKLEVKGVTEGGFTTLLAGTFTVRELRGGGDGFAVCVIDTGGKQALVRVTATEVKPLAVRKEVVTALTVEGNTVYWAEGTQVFSVPADGTGAITARASMVRALVTSLTAKGPLLLGTLIPKDLDPFSTEPSGALVELQAGGTVKLVAGEQVRPHDVLTDGTDAFWVAGYPSGLVRGALDGSYTARIADRADGPLASDGEGIVFRYPMSSSPELRRTARAGGNQVTLAHFDVDWLAAGGGVARFTTSGIGARLYEVKAGEEPKDLLTLKGAAKGLAMGGSLLVLATVDDSGKTQLRVKP